MDRENFLSDFSLPCIAQVITDQGLAHFVVVFKKTTIKDDGARRKHMLQDAETRKEEEEKGKKHKCKDYVIIGDPGTELKKISLDEFYKNFTGVLLLLNPTSEFKGGKIEKGGMMKRYINLLLPQKKLFFYAILSSIITTILGIASSMFNKILMDEVLLRVEQPAGHIDPGVQCGQHYQHADRLCAPMGADPSVHQDRYPADAGLLRAHLQPAHEVLCHPQDR